MIASASPPPYSLIHDSLLLFKISVIIKIILSSLTSTVTRVETCARPQHLSVVVYNDEHIPLELTIASVTANIVQIVLHIANMLAISRN